ncbi:Regulatory myosin light chain [Planoprotostelium fungivorum]|uniref:Regulatory myosin light chain n=1 Tax=Planoprotostelium fungivorum TaxID=1890364 RepID=A0A2P6MU76_9EUKA|nr:Regulatory myosin light chain [Planoprotostelium fungivorum]PRP75234.1 Regulatory myosin light chain [Planoprotostelium fungivorum]
MGGIPSRGWLLTYPLPQQFWVVDAIFFKLKNLFLRLAARGPGEHFQVPSVHTAHTTHPCNLNKPVLVYSISIMSKKEQTLSDDQVEEFRIAFDMFDEQQVGHVTKSDLKTVMDKYGVRAEGRVVDDMFKEADVTGAGKIGFPEFMSMMARRMKGQDTEDELLEAFRVFDPYNEGNIPEKELSDALTTQGDKLTKEELTEMLSICSVNKLVNYKVFVNAVYSSK